VLVAHPLEELPSSRSGDAPRRKICAGTESRCSPNGGSSMRGILVSTALVVVSSFSRVVVADDAGNAALRYWIAFALCPSETRDISAATTDDRKLGFGIPVGPQLATYFQGGGQRALLLLHRGAKSSSCDWATDLRADGPNVAAPYGEKAHALGRVALLRARWRFESGDWEGGIEDVVATMRLNRHIGRGKIWYNVHFGCMLEAMSTGTAAFYLAQMPENYRERLARELDLLTPVTSMHEVALYYLDAFDWAIDNFEQAEKEGRLFEMIASVSGKQEAEKALELAHDAAGLTKLARAGRLLAREIAEAMSLPPDRYDRMFKERFYPRLQANPIAAMLGPDYESARDEEATAHCRLLFVKTAIDLLRRGKSALSDHPDPYGDGPFEYVRIDGGFELGSDLVYGVTPGHRTRMRFGVRQIFP
jgi:hypothetical protein